MLKEASISLFIGDLMLLLQMPTGRSIYIGMLPVEKYSDISLLWLAQPFGKITGYYLNWRRSMVKS